MTSARESIRGACAAVVLAGVVLGGRFEVPASVTIDRAAQPAGAASMDGFTMGTTYAVRLAALPAGLGIDKLRGDVVTILEEVDRSMSTYRADSELSRFNRLRSVDWVAVSADLRAVVSAALEVSRTSRGAFDVTVAPLVDLWGFGPSGGRHVVPGAAEIDAALAVVGTDLVEVRARPPAIRKRDPRVRIDLSAIAKGFAVDRIAERLLAVGVDGFLVEIGGEVRASGRRTPSSPWRVAIQGPSGEPLLAETIVNLEAAAIATSGDYRNYFDADGRRYSHVIDPRNGHPVAHHLVSVSVIDASAARADALATALLVLGPTDGLALAESRGIAALFVTEKDGGFADVPTHAFERYSLSLGADR